MSEQRDVTARGSSYALDRVDWDDPLSYVREMYGVPAYVGRRVRWNGETGVVTGGYHQYVEVKLDEGDRMPFSVHPTWRLEFLDA